jgi:hypothetical protein
VINIQQIFETYARLTAWTTRARLLTDDLLTRYSIDDGSAPGSLPLVMEQPWMLNLNTYLTNSNSFLSTTNNSFSATTNEFVSRPILSSSAASQFVPPASSSSHPSQTDLGLGTVSKHETKTEQLDSVSSSRTSEKFRIRRKPGRVSSEGAAAVTQNIPRDPVSEPAKALTLRAGASARLGDEEKGTTAKANDARIATVRNTASVIAVPADLPLAPAAQDVQRNPVSEALTLYPGVTARPGEGEKGTTAKANDAKIATAKNTDSVIAAPADLPLASRQHSQSTVQRVLPDEDVNTSPVGSSNATAKGRSVNSKRPASQRINSSRVFSPLNRINEITSLTLSKTVGIPRPGPEVSRTASIQEQIVPAHSQERLPDSSRIRNVDGRAVAELPPLDFVRRGNAAARTALAEPGRPDFVWRRNADGRTTRELLSAVSNSSSLQGELAAGGTSTAQSPPSSQSVIPESVSRRGQPAGAEITAEGILRSISKTLLVERDRRGY